MSFRSMYIRTCVSGLQSIYIINCISFKIQSEQRVRCLNFGVSSLYVCKCVIVVTMHLCMFIVRSVCNFMVTGRCGFLGFFFFY